MTSSSSTRIGTLLLFAAAAVWGQQGSTGYLKAKVDPGRAGVFVDGKYIGPASNFRVARKYAVPVGEHEIKLIEPRYEEYTTKVSVVPGKTTTIKESLKRLAPAKPPFGRLRIKGAEKFSAVYLNDRYMGHEGEFNNSVQGLLLNPGEYQLRVVPVSGGQEHAEKLTITADKVTVVKIKP